MMHQFGFRLVDVRVDMATNLRCIYVSRICMLNHNHLAHIAPEISMFIWTDRQLVLCRFYFMLWFVIIFFLFSEFNI